MHLVTLRKLVRALAARDADAVLPMEHLSAPERAAWAALQRRDTAAGDEPAHALPFAHTDVWVTPPSPTLTA